MKVRKLIKNKCEIESCLIKDPLLLELHHILPRTDEHTNNNNLNLAILCCCHHKLLDGGSLKIIGVFPSTKEPNFRTLVYELDGKKNIDIDKPYIEFKNKSFKIFGESNE